MKYFKEILEQKGHKSGTHLSSNIKLVQPVVYFFFGESEHVPLGISTIKNFCDEKIRGENQTAFAWFKNSKVTHNDDGVYKITYDKDLLNLGKTLSLIQNEFLKKAYTRQSFRRVYLIVNTWESLNFSLSFVIKEIKRFFLELNNIAMIDVFAVTDESNIQDKSVRKNIGETLNLFSNLLEEKIVNMVYIISNFDNRSVLTGNFSACFEAIARSILIKDCTDGVSDIQSSYNETNYMDNCSFKNPSGYFYSIGMKKIDKPNEVINAIALRQLVKKRGFSDDNELKEHMRKFDFFKRIFSDDIYACFESPGKKLSRLSSSLAQNLSASTNIYSSRNEALEGFFGKNSRYGNNVNAYYEINMEKFYSNIFSNVSDDLYHCFLDAIKSCLLDINMGFFKTRDLLHYVKKNTLEELKATLEKKVAENQMHIKVWLEKPEYDTQRKTIQAFSKALEFPLKLAREYVELKNQITISEASLKIFNNTLKEINKQIIAMDAVFKELEESEQYLNAFISNNTELEPLTIYQNLEEYYGKKIDNYINNNYTAFFETVLSKFYIPDSQKTYDSDYKFTLCKMFADTMLESPVFIKNIHEEIYDRLKDVNTDSNEKITELLLKEILDNKLYFSNIISSENTYELTCFITGDKTLADKFKNSVSNACVFFDANDKSLSIIYFIGVFSPKQMFYAAKYGF